MADYLYRSRGSASAYLIPIFIREEKSGKYQSSSSADSVLVLLLASSRSQVSYYYDYHYYYSSKFVLVLDCHSSVA
eukprot:2132068-Rhodomonas_salina.2